MPKTVPSARRILALMPLVALFAAPMGVAAADTLPTQVCMSNDTVVNLTGFRITYPGFPGIEDQTGVFPVYQTRCLTVRSQIDGRAPAEMKVEWNYNQYGVAWTSWLTCTGTATGPIHSYSLRHEDVTMSGPRAHETSRVVHCMPK